MLEDKENLYEAYIEARQGNLVPEERNIFDNLGTWTGHRDKLQAMTNELSTLLEDYKNHCDDWDTEILDAQDLVNEAEEYAGKKPPQYPDRIVRVTLPGWATELGAYISNGVLVVAAAAATLGAAILAALQALAEVLGLLLKFQQG
jgi:hypothetical protein